MSIMATNITIKNNRKLLPQRDRFKNTLGGYSSGRKTEYNLPKAKAEHLKHIKNQLKKDRNIRMIKVVVLTIMLFLLLISVLIYNTDGIRELLGY